MKKAVAKFEGRISTKVRIQKKLDLIEKKNFKKEQFSGKYIVKMLYE